jgi:hypothetical protein
MQMVCQDRPGESCEWLAGVLQVSHANGLLGWHRLFMLFSYSGGPHMVRALVSLISFFSFLPVSL